MKKNVFLMLFLAIIGLASVNAQVRIGSDNPPNSGAILDLSSGLELGVLLPNVKLDSVTGFKVVSESDPAIDSLKKASAGMVVYNTFANTVNGSGEGLYIWDGSRWRALSLNGGSMKFSPASVPPISFATGNSDTVTVTSPAANGFNGDYTFVLIAGAAYADVTPASASDGKFSVFFHRNTTAVMRKAVVLVTDPAGNTSTYVFTQNPDASLCNATVPPNLRQTGDLGVNGAVYLDVTNPDTVKISGVDTPVNYFWTCNGVEVGSGPTYTATAPGKYIVYAGAIGCSTNAAVDLQISTITAPGHVLSVVCSNGGVICGGDSVDITAVGAPAGATLEWFKDGVRIPSASGKTIIRVAEIGNYFVAAKIGNLYSLPSNISTVVNGGGTGKVSLDPNDVLVNGVPINIFNSYCKGSSLFLTVQNQHSGTIYTWYNGNNAITNTNPYVVPANDSIIFLRLVATDNSGALCPNQAGILGHTTYAYAPTTAYITGNKEICSGQEITLIANGADSGTNYKFEWYEDNNHYGTTSDNFVNIKYPGSYKVRYSVDNGCWSDFSPVFTVSGIGVPEIEWRQYVTRVNSNSDYTFSVQLKNSATNQTSYAWTATPSQDPGDDMSIDVSNSTDLNSASGNTITLRFTGNKGYINLEVTPINSCGLGYSIKQKIDLITTTLPAPTVTPSGGSLCSGVDFKIEKPAVWTSQQWFSFSASNISARLGNSAYNGKLTYNSSDSAYHYYIKASTTTEQEAKITIEGQIGAIKVTPPTTVTVKIKQPSSASTFTVNGISCFDINLNNETGRVKADFNRTYIYKLDGNLANGEVIDTVIWTYTNPKNAVQQISSSTYSLTSVSNNQIEVKYDPALMSDATIDASGIVVMLTATITTVSGGSCPKSVYIAEVPVVIKNAPCCPGIVIYGGVHNVTGNIDVLASGSNNSGNDKTYDWLLQNKYFTRDASKNLCVYYKDAQQGQKWETAKDNCANGNNVDPAHRSMNWRLPNIAELGQMNTYGADKSKAWAPRYDALASAPNAFAGTTNMRKATELGSNSDTKRYWSITEGGNRFFSWAFSRTGTAADAKTVQRQVRCVMTMD